MNASEQRQLRDLTLRLAQAEATIQALVCGQVDAVVDTGTHTPLLLSKAQEALRASEDRYRSIVETTSEGIWLTDAGHKTTFMNRRMAQLLGCEADMGLGRSPFDFLDQAGRAELTSRIERPSAYQSEVRYIRADGMNVWALVAGTPVFDRHGRFDGWLAMVKDITERKAAAAAEEELSQCTERRERMLSTTLSAITDFAYIYDRNGRFLFANQPLLALWGITLEEAVGKDCFDLGYPNERAVRLQRQVQAVFDTGVGETGETPYTSPAGIEGYYEYIFTPVFGADGSVEFVAGSTRDVSGSKKIQHDLMTRTHDLEVQAAVLTEQAALLDLAQDAIIVADMAGHVLFWNRGAEALYGWLRHEAVGQLTHELLRTQFAEPIEGIAAVLRREGRWEGEVIHHARDGRQVNVVTRWTLQRDADGTPIRVLGINQDVTLRKQDDADRALLTQRLSLAADVARLGVWDWDLTSNTLTWDATMFAMYGFTPIVPMQYEQWSAAVHPDDLPGVEAILQRAIDEKGQGAAEFRIILADGSVRNVSAVERVVLDERMNVRRVVGVNMDVTAQREAEAVLRTARETAEGANRAKSEFLANMSHEIRTPMNGVIGMTALVLDSELTIDQRENLGIVKSSADALLGVINDILDFSKIEAGKLAVDSINFSIRDTIGDTATALALRAQQKGLELIADVDDAVPDILRGDPGRLRQILVNLLGNAIKFTERGEVVLGVTLKAGTSQDVELHFSIRDTGIGVPSERQDSIFQPFVQVDGSTTRAYGGTGLGLTIASQLVTLMGGRLGIESEAGRGSTFSFTASFAPAEGEIRPAVVPDVQRLHGVPVLITDDNATNRRLLEEILLGWRMVPTLAASAPEALSALRRAQAAGQPIPLVLTDVVMPGTDGFMLTSAIMTDPAIASAAVVIISSAGRPGDVARCRELGIAAYLQKPVRRADLRGAMLIALKRSAATPVEVVTHHTLRAHASGRRILIVDDNPVNQRVAQRLLEKRGHTVLVAENGREALAILTAASSGVFACVLMDVQMPLMDGFECTAAIREHERTAGGHLPIIAMTAHALEGDDIRCLEAGMDGYMSKPIEVTRLYATLERYLGDESLRR